MRIEASVLLALVGLGAALDNGLGHTPPLGFNPWNCFGVGRTGNCKLVNPNLPKPGCHPFNESVILAVADALVSTGLRDAGYKYVNLDCGWTTGFRDNATGQLIVNTKKFPHGMKYLGDQLHARGLKYGIYLSASGGAQCCSNQYPGANDGSGGHETLDAALITSYGVDYLKYDGCTPKAGSFEKMRDALNATGREIFYSVNGPKGDEAVPIANAWRTTGDIDNTFGSMFDRALQNDGFAHASGAGSFAMPDMLEIGNFYEKTAELSNAVSRTMMSIWCSVKAPLLIGTDVTLPRAADDKSIAIMANTEALAINQDTLAEPARLVKNGVKGGTVFSGNLSGSRFVLSVTNNATAASNVTVNLSDAFPTTPKGARFTAHDVWANAAYRTLSGEETFELAQWDSILLTIKLA